MKILLQCLSVLLIFAGCSNQHKEVNTVIKENEPAEEIEKVYKNRPYAFTNDTLKSVIWRIRVGK